MLGAIVRVARRRFAAALIGLLVGGIALAQDTVPPSAAAANAAAPPGTATVPLAPASVAPASVAPAPQLSAAQLDQLVAPVALYPDPLLAQVLMASTYPIEVVEAARWIAGPTNRTLAGDALVKAVAAENWDPSVKALVAFPDVLRMLSDRLEWTQDLGNAVLASEAQVMDAVQRLRRQAMAAGTLKTTPQCDCTVEASGDTIAIQPVEPEQVRVPVYGPDVYGAWPYPDYPPDTFASPDQYSCPPGYWLLCYGEPVDLASFGPLWGWSWIAWPRLVIVVRPRAHRVIAHRVIAHRVIIVGRRSIAVRVWVHDPAHRGAVRYADAATRARFDAARRAELTTATRADMRADAAMPVRRDGSERLTALRNEAARDWAGRTGDVSVLRGGPAAFHPAADPQPRGRPVFRVAPTVRLGPAAVRPIPAMRAGAPHPAVAAGHGGARSGRLR